MNHKAVYRTSPATPGLLITPVIQHFTFDNSKHMTVEGRPLTFYLGFATFWIDAKHESSKCPYRLFRDFSDLHGLQSMTSSVNWGRSPNCFLMAIYLQSQHS